MTPIDTTSQNVATNTPQIIAQKRGLEGFAIVLGTGIAVSALEALQAALTTGPGAIDWRVVGSAVITAVIAGAIKAILAYTSANSNVAANAADTKG